MHCHFAVLLLSTIALLLLPQGADTQCATTVSKFGTLASTVFTSASVNASLYRWFFNDVRPLKSLQSTFDFEFDCFFNTAPPGQDAKCVLSQLFKGVSSTKYYSLLNCYSNFLNCIGGYGWNLSYISYKIGGPLNKKYNPYYIKVQNITKVQTPKGYSVTMICNNMCSAINYFFTNTWVQSAITISRNSINHTGVWECIKDAVPQFYDRYTAYAW